MFRNPRQVCADCHFFVKEARGVAPTPVTLEISAQNRALSKAGDNSWHADHYALLCVHTVWDEGHNFLPETKHAVVTSVDRRGQCFFWKHRPGMLIPAAKVLQEREAHEQEASTDRRLTVVGLWIAVLALVVQVVLQVATAAKWGPFK